MVHATKASSARASKRRTQNKRRASKLSLSVLALFVTFLPLFTAGLWVKAVFFSDPRQIVALQTIQPDQRELKLFEEPIITVTFDDGWENVYSKGAKTLEKYGIRTTQYVLSGAFKHKNYLSKDQLLSLMRAGHDIQSHTVGHRDLTSLDPEELTFELKQSRDDLSKILGYQVTDFASPLSSFDSGVVDEVREHYRSHRNTEADIDELYDEAFNTPANFDIYSINAYSLRNQDTVADLQRYIAAAKERKAWIILVYHEIDDSQNHYTVTPAEFDRQMKAVKDSGFRIATMDEVLDTYQRSHHD